MPLYWISFASAEPPQTTGPALAMQRWAVVTGAGTGIGAAVTRELLRARVNVVAVGRREAPLDELRRSINSGGEENGAEPGIG